MPKGCGKMAFTREGIGSCERIVFGSSVAGPQRRRGSASAIAESMEMH